MPFSTLEAKTDSLDNDLIDVISKMDLKKLVFSSIKENYYTKVNDQGLLKIEIHFSNEDHSHTVNFKEIISIEHISTKMYFYHKYNDTKINLIFDVLADNNQRFICNLYMNHDFTVYDICYLES